jgi:two-component system chemotaxis response regulator CheY
MRFLLVDDSTTMRNIQRKILAGLGHNDMSEAADGVQAFAAFGAQRPDIMLVDWNMPNMDGLTLVKKVREVDKNVLIIMVTTEAGKSHVIDAIKAGVNNYVVKPFTASVLSEKLEQTLSKRAQAVGTS